MRLGTIYLKTYGTAQELGLDLNNLPEDLCYSAEVRFRLRTIYPKTYSKFDKQYHQNRNKNINLGKKGHIFSFVLVALRPRPPMYLD